MLRIGVAGMIVVALTTGCAASTRALATPQSPEVQSPLASTSGAPVPIPSVLHSVPSVEVRWGGVQDGASDEIQLARSLAIGVLLAQNPGAYPITWEFDVAVLAGQRVGFDPSQVGGGATLGDVYCDARVAISSAGHGTIVVPAGGSTTVNLRWPRCSGKPWPSPRGYYTAVFTAHTLPPLQFASLDSQVFNVR